ncbi:hypothetical protein ACQPZF_12760 [Actinosynnema sp. CS-041913]|uniref:hypothetical protein n=1 Tax=Actinosynnema sp. CS-041913 TaxID=3239917 RepID=UPI003D8F2B21
MLVPAVGMPAAHAGPASGAGQGEDCAAALDWSSCVQVVARLDRAPAVGETARLSVEVGTAVDLRGARIEVDLPSALGWDERPAGSRVDRLGPLLPEDGDGVHRAWRSVDLEAGGTFQYTGSVRGVAAAATSVRARLVGPSDTPVDDDEHLLLLTVGGTSAESYLGLDAERNSTALEALPDGMTLTPSTPHLDFQAVPADDLPAPHSDDPPSSEPTTQALSCVTGTVGYEFPAATGHPSPNIQVQAWDDDSFGGDDLLDTALTDGRGGFRLCFDNDDVSGGQDVYVRVRAENGLWRVTVDLGFLRPVYEFRSAQRDDIGDGRTVDLGRLAPADQTLHRVLHAFDLANDAQEWTPGECWDARDTGDCRRMEIVYPDDDANDNSRYTLNDNTVRLEPAAPDDRTDTVHEYGHAVMDDVYEDAYPNAERCSPHQMDRRSSEGCAWTEGFANFYPMAIYNRDEYRGWRVEDTARYDTGDDTEGRVTGSLWDLMDPAGEAYWDGWQESARDAIWDTFLDRRSNDFREFWTHRGEEGHDVGPGPAGALFQNTIDYGFRFPITDGAALTRPTPDPPHNYRFDTTFAFWSVVALRPPAGADYDVRVYDDSAHQQLLGSSVLPGSTVDFVAVDSAIKGTGDFYPVVSRPAGSTGTGDYRIELAATGRLLIGPVSQTMAGLDDVAAVWDICPGSGGADITITVTPSDPSQDAELFLMDSDPAAPATAVVGRSAALAESTGNGPNQPESVRFTPQGGCYGVVLVNKAGSGSYNVTLS